MIPAREMERMMKLQDVILKAIAKKITWIEAAEIAGMSVRNMQRKRHALHRGAPKISRAARRNLRRSSRLAGWRSAASPPGAHKPGRLLLLPLPSNGYRILLAEDNVVNQRLARRLLELQGYSVSLANDGVEAIDAFAAASFDLILMDVQMPRIEGYEAAARIREIERTRNTACAVGRAGTMPRGRNGRISVQAHRSIGIIRQDRRRFADGRKSRPHELDSTIYNRSLWSL